MDLKRTSDASGNQLNISTAIANYKDEGHLIPYEQDKTTYP